LTLERGCIDVWFASLEGHLADVQEVLSPDELERAASFRFDRDRDRFAVGRMLLRTLLEQYTGEPKERIRFAYGPFGKPFLAEGTTTFNVSHSEDRAMFAFSQGLEIGVDIEALASRPSDRDVAERFFSSGEVRALTGLPLEQQARAFLTCWTRKEAFVKARGDGLSLSLQDFDVTLEPSAPSALLRTAWSRSEPSEWSLFDLSNHCQGWLAALAVRAPHVKLRVRRDPHSEFVGSAFEPGLSAGLASTPKVAA
jgi:4'-phosphopantetheinyl transferase